MRQIALILGLLVLSLSIYTVTQPEVSLSSFKTEPVHQNPAQQYTEGGGNSQRTPGLTRETSPDSSRKPIGQIGQPESQSQQTKPRENQQPSVISQAEGLLSGIKLTDVLNVLLTAALTWVGCQQLRTYREQAKLMEGQIALSHQQLELSRQEAAYTRRPHFRVRFARLLETDGKLLAAGKPVTVMLDVLNNGQADAVIFISHLEIYWTDKGLPGYYPWFDINKRNNFATKGQSGGLIVAGGFNLDIEMAGYRTLGNEVDDIEWGRNNWTMYILGWIGYQRTDNKSNRFFDFGLQYQPGTSRFLPMSDPDYSYDPDGK